MKPLLPKTQLGVQVKGILDRGELVADDVIMALVKERLAQDDAQNGYLLDGFPRTLGQAQGMQDEGIDVDFVVYLEVDDHPIVERMSGRLHHPPSGRVYHVMHNSPQQPGMDDVTGEPLKQRDDDHKEVVLHRLEVYRNLTAPLLDYYDQWQLSHDVGAPTFIKVDGMLGVAAVSNAIFQGLGVEQ